MSKMKVLRTFLGKMCLNSLNFSGSMEKSSYIFKKRQISLPVQLSFRGLAWLAGQLQCIRSCMASCLAFMHTVSRGWQPSFHAQGITWQATQLSCIWYHMAGCPAFMHRIQPACLPSFHAQDFTCLAAQLSCIWYHMAGCLAFMHRVSRGQLPSFHA